MPDENIVWAFYGYETPAGGRDVQDWFDGLPNEARDEALDTLGYLQVLPVRLWGLPHFEVFDADISEIRFRVGALNRWYRIYGTFGGPENRQYSYTFLLGKEKKVKKDKRGVELARERLKKLRNREARAHGFRFSEKPNS
jgi:hypothetical protein